MSLQIKFTPLVLIILTFSIGIGIGSWISGGAYGYTANQFVKVCDDIWGKGNWNVTNNTCTGLNVPFVEFPNSTIGYMIP